MLDIKAIDGTNKDHKVEIVLIEDYEKLISFFHPGRCSIHDYVNDSKKIGEFDFLIIDDGRLTITPINEGVFLLKGGPTKKYPQLPINYSLIVGSMVYPLNDIQGVDDGVLHLYPYGNKNMKKD